MRTVNRAATSLRDLEELKAAASMGYAREKLFEEAKTLPRNRTDW
jgi:hypothetical protein